MMVVPQTGKIGVILSSTKGYGCEGFTSQTNDAVADSGIGKRTITDLKRN